jgi:hypothetical protein
MPSADSHIATLPGVNEREELIALVRTAVAARITQEHREQTIDRLQSLLPLVPWIDYMFWPTGFPHDPIILAPTPEQIVDRALAFRSDMIVIPPTDSMSDERLRRVGATKITGASLTCGRRALIASTRLPQSARFSVSHSCTRVCHIDR